MKQNKILIGTSVFGEFSRQPIDRLKSLGYEVVENPFKRKFTKNELSSLLTSDVIGLLAGLETLDHEIMKNSQLKVISRVGSGMSNVDIPSAEQLGIGVYSTPNGPTQSVAELTLGAMISLLRMIPEMDSALHKGEWSKKTGFLLEGKSIAIIGFGRIGQKLAQLLKPFNVNLYVVDPYITGSDFDDINLVSLEQAVSEVDIITLHTSGEECLLGPKEFSAMKKGVFILNVARGGLIDEQELIKRLDDKTVRGAWLDTYSTEPYKGDLKNYSQVLLTPHVGSYTIECRIKMEMEAVENLIQALELKEK